MHARYAFKKLKTWNSNVCNAKKFSTQIAYPIGFTSYTDKVYHRPVQCADTYCECESRETRFGAHAHAFGRRSFALS